MESLTTNCERALVNKWDGCREKRKVGRRTLATALMSAPSSISRRATSKSPLSVAKCRGVRKSDFLCTGKRFDDQR